MKDQCFFLCHRVLLFSMFVVLCLCWWCLYRSGRQ